MKIAVIGTGYVGLVSGACFADRGNSVTCIDIDPLKIQHLCNAQVPIHEPGLEPIIRNCLESGRIKFTTSYQDGLVKAEVVFIAVGTPPGEDGSADLSHVLNAARTIGEVMSRPLVVVDKSTVPVGTADLVRKEIEAALAKRNLNLEFSVVSNPEFLKEGAAIEDFMKPDRIVIGCDSQHAQSVMQRLYSPFCRNHDRLIFMSIRSAELTKYAANAMLATRISFMNELANLSEKVGADIESVRRGIGSDKRIGTHFLYAGAGYGGSCFPKDVKALIRTANQNGIELNVVKAVEHANEIQKTILVEKIEKFFDFDLNGKKVALWGLAFKANTDDMREASSLVLIDSLVKKGASISAYDPVAKKQAQQIYQTSEKVQIVDSASDALLNADVLVVLTEWKEFHCPNFNDLALRLNRKALFDGRNLYDPEEVKSAGLSYFGIGRSGNSNAKAMTALAFN
jgi:UDPglucose 6-dehydrogenase